ncbi:hypothetical protein [Caulobacter sp. S45]|uniref:hypothetical protein n=1 Tax=Caulobacter sp. S45 TaxID=1641861 RepID=UPI00131C461B|nr:hypothetical protein [Caulobacter sp. S45]
MTMLLNRKTPTIPSEDGWLAGRTVVHKIVIGLSDPQACLAAVAEEFCGETGRIEAFTLNPLSGGAYEAVLRAADLSMDAADRLVSRLCKAVGVRSVQIEHMLIR